MGKDKKKIQVVAGLLIREDKILVAKRALHKTHGGLWEFPGGKIERGEEPSEALQRELLEELSVAVCVGSFVASSQVLSEDIEIEMSVFAVQILRGDLINKEHEELRWISPQEVAELKWAPADIPLLPAIVSFCGL